MKTSPQAARAFRNMMAESAATHLRPLRPGERVPGNAIDVRVFQAIGLMHEAMANERKRDRSHKAVIGLNNGELKRLEEIVPPVALLHLLAAAGVNAGWFYQQVKN